MRRLFWVTLGATLGVLIVRKLTQLTQRLTPTEISRSVREKFGDITHSWREFGHDVRTAMTEREADLRAAAALDGGQISSTRD